MINKKDVIRLLETIAIYMELKGENPFKVAAFRKAAGGLETDERSLSEIDDFTKIPGIGKGTGAVITEFMTASESSVLQELKSEVPEGLIPLIQLPGLGGKKIAKLYKELGIENVDELKAACVADKVATLKGFGKKSQEKILEAIKDAGKQPDRLPIAYMLKIAEQIESKLAALKNIEQFSRAGSLRRVRETIKDLDFIIATNEPKNIKDQLLAMEGVIKATLSGDTKVTVIYDGTYEVSIDFRIVTPKQFSSTLHHFTGSKDHNIRMRQLAKDRGERISEYGVEVLETGEVITFESEADFYAHFQLPWIPPEIREDGKEVEEYHEHLGLIALDDIKGDLHMHTSWSDGAYSLQEMIEACRRKGYEYMAITDHSQYLRVANGLSADRLRNQIDEIKTLNEKYTDIEILAGIEMDILPDGQLDFDDSLLKELDIVIASIHSSFQQSEEKIMERLKSAMMSPHVDIIAHPTGRLIGRRAGYAVNMEQLIEWAVETRTALELNAHPERLDLSSTHLRRVQDAGGLIVINTDAHHTMHLDYMPIGVATARKGWLRQQSILNSFTKTELLKFLRRND